MRQISKDIEMEYRRIVKRASEDPGTAGDEGEESWAELLRNWLPATYHIVTKGRILFEDNTASPQVDILVLSPNYPRHLRNKKMYFAGGVVAAFECKLTLKGNHLDTLFKTSKIIKERCQLEDKTLYSDFNAPIIYGLLAHSHSWSKNIKTSDQVFNIMKKLANPEKVFKFDQARFYPDIICVSDVATYCYRKNLILSTELEDGESEVMEDIEAENAITLSYDAYWAVSEEHWMNGIVHGTLLSFLFHKMAYNDPSLRSLATYFKNTDIASASIGYVNTVGVDLEDYIITSYHQSGGASNPWNPWGKQL